MRSRKQILLNTIILLWNIATSTSWLALCTRNSLNSVCSCLPLAGRITIDRAPAALGLLSVTVHCYWLRQLWRGGAAHWNWCRARMEQRDPQLNSNFCMSPNEPGCPSAHPQWLFSQKTSSILKSKCLGLIHVQVKHCQACLLFSCLPHKISCSEVLLLW